MNHPNQQPVIETPPVTVEITSDQGETVLYTIHPFGADDGFRMFQRLIPFMASAIQTLAGITIKGAALPPVAPESDRKEDEANVIDMVAEDESGDVFAAMAKSVELDGRKIADGLREFSLELSRQASGKFIRELLQHTTCVRGGTSGEFGPSGGTGYAPGRNPIHFNQIYKANYGEMFAAVYHVLRVNWGPMIGRVLKGEDPLDVLFGGARQKPTRR